MLRNIALATAVLVCAAGAGKLSAQDTAKTKSTPQVTHKAPTTAAAPAKPSAGKETKWTKDQITEAQQGLAKAGYYKGKPTGVMNADTRKALKAFEKANNMPATGRLSDSVLAKLKSA
jgi:peptidoglycan hydrolase-like protein with peptidoglycan-binding domain